MGLLDGMFGGNQGGGGGGPSGMTMALMALLAYRTYQGKGRLADMLGRGASQGGQVPQGGGPGMNAPGAAESGGLGGLLGGLFGGSGAGGSQAGGMGGGGLGDLLRGGGLGGLLGGAGGAAGGGFMGAGLNELISKMQQNGHGDVANSWVGSGPNSPIAPHQLEQAIGKDTLQELSTETGKPYDTVLSDLVKGLPGTVDKLTPSGRMPTTEEHASWV